jgi:uncharacterized protein YcaQ
MYHRAYIETSWFKTEKKKSQISEKELETLLKYVAENGPVRANKLPDIGKVKPQEWDGWKVRCITPTTLTYKSTAKKSSTALDVLWTQCKVVAFRTAQREKCYQLPESFFAEEIATSLSTKTGILLYHDMSTIGKLTVKDVDFESWAMIERVEAMGLCSSSTGPHWSTIKDLRNSDKLEKMVEDGLIEKVQIEGATKMYLTKTCTEVTW